MDRMVELDLSKIFRSNVGDQSQVKLEGALGVSDGFGATYKVEYAVKASLNKLDDQVYVKVMGLLDIPSSCDRCLKLIHLKENLDFDMVVENDRILHLKNFMLPIEDELKANIILQIPIKKLCVKKCLGLCPICGADKNIKSCDCKTITYHNNPFSILKGKSHGSAKEKNHQ